MEDKLNRREFLKNSTFAALGAGLALGAVVSHRRNGRTILPERDEKAEPADRKPLPEFRRLGKTGLKVKAVGFGAMLCRESAVIRHALDLGVNYVDTARGYLEGENEKIVGEAIRDRRNDIVLATKIKPGSRDEMAKLMDDSLRALGTDHVDIIQLHNLRKAEGPKNEEWMAALTQFKKEGKARFCGVTTHKNQVAVIDAAIATGFYDMVLVGYNFQSPPEITRAISRAARAGLGVVAMKTLAGGYKDGATQSITPYQAALKWVLADRNVSCVLPGMVTIKEVDEDLAVMGRQLTWSDRKLLDRHARQIARIHCRMCGGCSGACPRGVEVQEINRFLMYAEGYGEREFARQHYRALPETASARPCAGCHRCVVKCRFGLPVAARMRRAYSLLG